MDSSEHRGGLNTSRIARIGQLLCVAGAVLGAFGLLTWLFGAGDLSTMAPHAAFALTLVGMAGALRRREGARGLRRVSIVLASMTVLAIGLGTLAEYAFAVDLRIDQLLLPVPDTEHAVRPSPLSVLALSLLAVGVLVFDSRPVNRGRPSEWLVIAGGLMAFIALLGMLFGAGRLYFLPRAPVMAVSLPTAVSQLLISAGLLLERPTAGLMRVATSPGPGGILLRRLSLVAILVPTVLGTLISRLVRVVGVENYHLSFALLAVAMTVTSLVFLTLTAVPLNRTHEALAASRAQTADLVEQAADGIFLADLTGRYTDVNRAGCQMLGCTREEIIGKTIFDLIPAEDAERLLQSKTQMLEGGSHVGEWKLRRKDGTYITAEVNATILPDGRWQGLVRDISERKAAEQRLRQSQERFELALRGADLASWDWNVVTGDCIFNARWAEMRGLKPEEIVHQVQSWSGGVHPEDWPRVQAVLNDCWEGRIPDYETEHRVRTKSNQWIWILDRGRVFSRDDQGRPTRMVGTELDITERKRAEEALQLSEARSSGILSISADAIISIDEAQRITMYNEGAEKLFGYSRSEILGAQLDLLIPHRFHAVHRQHVERFAASTELARRMGAQGMPIYGLRKNGEEFPADATISRLEVGGNKLFTVALRDVTEQKRVESEQRFLAEAGSVLAMSLDYEDTLSRIAELAVRDLADVCIVDINAEDDELRRLQVVSRDPTKAWACDILMQNPPGTPQQRLLLSLLKRGRAVLIGVSSELIASFAQNAEHIRALRAIEPVFAIFAPLFARGSLIGVITLVSSRTSRAFGTADVRLAEELAHRAALSIDNARLYGKAQQAIQAREDVLGVVVHDLRTPLSTIRMQAALLRRQGAEPERRSSKAADTIERAITRMNRLIQDLLEVTQLEAGHLSIELRQVPTRRIVTDSVDAQRTAFAQAAIDLDHELPQDLPDVWADRDRLLQVFENLIGNGLKFTQAGGRVVAGAAARDGEVLFWVRDNGIGISSEDLPHVFDRFWQAQKAERQGAGLGLPIVKGIVEAHGGRIWVESGQGRGSTFFFTIPTAPRVELRPEAAPRGP